MKRILLILTFALLGSLGASAQNYNFNIGGLQHSSGPSVPAACSRPGSYFYKNTSTRGWYICNGSTYDAMAIGSSSSGTVTSVLGTTNQITSDGSTTTPTLSIPSTFIGPGSVTATTTLGVKGATSGTSTFTAAAVAGTSTNPVTMTNVLSGPVGAAGAATYGFSDGSGMYLASTTLAWGLGNNARMRLGAATGAGLDLFSNESYCWNNNAVGSGFGTVDTCLSRDAADVFDFGTTTSDTTGRLQAAGYISKGTKFTTNAGCGESAGTTTGGATAGKFTTAGSTNCTSIVTLGNSATAPNGWECFAHDLTTTADYNNPRCSSNGTTVTIVTGTIVASDVIEFGLIGY